MLVPFGLEGIDGKCDEGCGTGPQFTCDDGCDDFSNMWRLSLLCSMVPLLTFVLNSLLVPNFSMASGIKVDPVTKMLIEIPA